MINSASSYSIQAIQAQMSQMNDAAKAIADPDSGAGIAEIVQLKQSQSGIEVNVAVLRRINETAGHLLDIIV